MKEVLSEQYLSHSFRIAAKLKEDKGVIKMQVLNHQSSAL